MGRRRRVSNRNAKVRVSFQRSSPSPGVRSSRTRNSVHAPPRPEPPTNTVVHPPSVPWVVALETPRRRDAGPLPPVPRRFGPLAAAKAREPDKNHSKEAASKPIKSTVDCEDARYSLMQVPEDPGFYVPTPPKEKANPEYAHVGALDGSGMEYTLFPTASKRYGSYIVRAPPSAKGASAHGSDELNNKEGHLGRRRSSRHRGGTHRVAVLDPLVEESLQRTLSQQNRLSCIVTPTKTKARAGPSSPLQATRGQRALSRFTKELERYCVAASTNGRVPLPLSTPTVSESQTTLETVTEFLPYHKQFTAAGLAVTSREQMPRISESVHLQVPAKHAGRNVSRAQVDGSTLTSSDQERLTQDPEAPVVPDKENTNAANTQPSARQAALNADRAYFHVEQSPCPKAPPKPVTKSPLHTANSQRTARQAALDADRAYFHVEQPPRPKSPSKPATKSPLHAASSQRTARQAALDADRAYFHVEKPPRPKSPSKPATRSMLPWFLKKNSSVAPNSHDDRKALDDHVHPTPATQGEPLLSPAGVLDSYFDAPEPPDSQLEPSGERKTSVSSHAPNNVNSRTEKPLPKQPPVMRRPIPVRSERRHMDNTAEWPTAGVLIHDKSLPPPTHDDSIDYFDGEHPSAKNSISIHSWATMEDEQPNEVQRSSSPPPNASSDTKPETPPKDEPSVECGLQDRRHHHPGHFICKKVYKATHLRRRSISKPLPIPTPIREESETSAEGAEKPLQTVAGPQDSTPRLPEGLPVPVDSSSSFEKALDAVITKLDAIEERRRYERQLDLEAAHRAVMKSEPPKTASSEARSLHDASAPLSKHAASTAAFDRAPSSEAAIEASDRDINDRDILVGLKMAICAACDEDLDAWICSKTGLRLRRFLADLKAFESVSQDRKALPPAPISRRIRRGAKDIRQAPARPPVGLEPKKGTLQRWSPCFGGDGQGSLGEASHQETRPGVA